MAKSWKCEVAKSWKCEVCTEPVSELASFVKISASVYRHRLCHDAKLLELFETRWKEAQAKQRALDDANLEVQEALARQWDNIYSAGVRKGIKVRDAEIKQAEIDAAQEEKDRARQVFNGLPRCQRCGCRYADPDTLTDIRAHGDLNWGEIRERSNTPRVCKPCFDEETSARQQARGSPAAQAIMQAAAKLPDAPEPKQDPPKPDRFNLIEIE